MIFLERSLKGVETAARAGWQVLTAGGSAVDAVEAAVVSLEDNPVFDAGRLNFHLLHIRHVISEEQ